MMETHNNPMADDYELEANRNYAEGPGAAISLDGTGDKDKSWKVCIRNAPTSMTKHILYNLCNQFGKVIHINDTQTKGLFFVTFPSLADAEATIRVLNDTPLYSTMKVSFAREREKLQPIPDQEWIPVSDEPISKINMDQRKFKGPFSKPLPIQFPDVLPILTETDYHENTVLNEIDPHRELLQRNDQQGYTIIDSDQNKRDCNSNVKTFVGPNGVNKIDSVISSQLSLCVCKRPAAKECTDCGHLYCSLECQSADWWKHEEFCLPRLSELDDSMEHQNILLPPAPLKKNQIKVDAPKNFAKVRIVYILQTNVVYVRQIHPQILNASFIEDMNLLQCYADKSQYLEAVPKIGEIVLVPYNFIYYRGYVVRVKLNQQVVVFLLDYGLIVAVNFNQIKEACDEAKTLPMHVFKVRLERVPNVVSAEANSFLQFLMEQGDLKMRFSEPFDEGKSVELIDAKSNRSVNERLIKLINNAPKKNPRIMIEHIDQIKIDDTKKDLSLTIICNDLATIGNITCIPTERLIDLERMHDRIQQYCSDITLVPYTAYPNEVILVDINGTWYRAFILEYNGDQFPCVQFIDFGSTDLVHMSNIRKLPSQFRMPILNFVGQIQDLNVMDNVLEETEISKLYKEIFPVNLNFVVEKWKVIEDSVVLINAPALVNDFEAKKAILV